MRSCLHTTAVARPARAGAIALACMLFALVLVPVHASAAFVARPSPGAGGSSFNPAAELMYDNGTLHAAWTDGSGHGQASTYGAGTWTPLPQVGTSAAGRRTDPSLAWDGTRLWGAVNDGTDVPIVKYLNAGVWTNITSPAGSSSPVWSLPSLAWDGTLLWAAWQDSGQVVRVATWNGATWTNRASPGGGSGNAYPDLEYNAVTNSIWVAFNAGGYAQVHEWTGASWASRGSVGDGSSNKIPGMTDVNGTVMVGWDDAPNHEVRTHVRVGTTWHEVDSHRPGTSPNFSYPDLAWTGTSLWATNSDTQFNVGIEAWEWDGATLMPVDRQQRRDDGTTTIPAAGTTIDGVSTNVRLRFQLISISGGQTATPWIEIRPWGTPFSAACGSSVAGVTFSGSNVTLASAGQPYQATVDVTGLTAGTDYHWRACSRVGALASAWAEDDAAQRFTVVEPPAPTSMYSDDSNASAGSSGNTAITQDDFRLSWASNAGDAVDRQRVQVVTTPLDDVVALWHLDGDGTDASGNGHTLSGASPTFGPSMTGFGQAAGFDGNDTYAGAGHDPAFDLSTFTVDGWMRTSSSLLAFEHVVNKWVNSSNATFSVHVEGSNGRLHADLSAGGASVTSAETSYSVVDGEWHHFAMVVDSTPADPNKTISLYVDGALAQQVLFSGSVDAPTVPVRIGSRDPTGNFFNGDIDDVRVTARALTAAELRGAYATRRPHATTVWDSDTGDAGVALGSSCTTATRCPDVTYGATGSPTPLVYDGARYHARAKLRTTAGGIWSAWSGWDWFETQNSTSISTAGCTGPALDLGTIVAGQPAVTSQDCTVTWGSAGTTTQLRIYQTDGLGAAAWAPSDGAADTAFSGDGVETYNVVGSGTEVGTSIAEDAAGNVVVGGTTTPGATQSSFVLRALPDGTLDPAFNGGTALTWDENPGSFDNVAAVVPMADGRILAVGGTGSTVQARRLTSTGALDPTFDVDGRATYNPTPASDAAQDAFVRPDGRIVLFGNSGSSGNVFLAQLLPDGSYDTSFGTSGVVTITNDANGASAWGDAHLTADGRIAVLVRQWTGTQYDVRVLVYTDTGIPDGSFAGDGDATFDPTGAVDEPRAITSDSQGRLLVAGDMPDTAPSDIGVLRLLADGTPDPSFDGDGLATFDLAGREQSARGIGVRPDGTILVGARDNPSGSDWQFLFVAFRDDGTLDTRFDGDGWRRIDVAPGLDDRINDARGFTLFSDGGAAMTGYANFADRQTPIVKITGAPLADYANGVSDIDQGASTFGACLRSTSSSVADWIANASCPATDGAHWNPIPQTSASPGTTIAHTVSAVPAASTSMRFLARTSAGVPAGTTFVAPITIEVIDPEL